MTEVMEACEKVAKQATDAIRVVYNVEDSSSSLYVNVCVCVYVLCMCTFLCVPLRMTGIFREDTPRNEMFMQEFDTGYISFQRTVLYSYSY